MKPRKQKRVEAEARQVEHNNLSFIEKLNKIESRPGKSTKERRKLTEAISKAQGKEIWSCVNS